MLLDTPVTVIEISLGGMAVETAMEFPVGVVHPFRLTLGDDSTVDLLGRVLRCRNIAEEGGAARYRVGIQFVDEPANGSPGVDDVIDRIG